MAAARRDRRGGLVLPDEVEQHVHAGPTRPTTKSTRWARTASVNWPIELPAGVSGIISATDGIPIVVTGANGDCQDAS